MNGEILKLSKYICSFNSDIDADAYAEQLNMLYGAVYEMNAFIPIMFDEIVEIETARIKANGVNVIKMINNVEMLIIEYSKIAFDLGRKSLYENRAFRIASALKVVFSELTSSTLIEKDMKLSLKSIISETELDFGYAAGNHNVASLRMAQLIREYKANNGGKLNKVIQLPKFALQYIKKKKLEQCYDIFKNISNDFDGNALNILFNFFENMKIFVKANERERVLGRFSNILYNLMKDYDYKITDLLNYLIRQNFYYSKTGLFCFPLEQIQLLEDYLNMCKKYSMKYEKFEQHLEKAHNIVAKNVKVLERTKGKENLFKESVDSYQHLEQKSKEYSILVPKDIDDLIQEGNFLHHCVGSYADKIINKDSKIFFMRLNKEIDKPFVTIEIDKNNQFVEARCIYNNIPEPEIMSFIKSWVKSLKSKGEV